MNEATASVGYLLVAYFFPGYWVTVNYGSWDRSRQSHLVVSPVIISNGHTEKLKDFTIACDALGNSGSVIETVTTKLYEVVDHGKSLVVPEIEFGPVSSQTADVKCRASDASHAENPKR